MPAESASALSSPGEGVPRRFRQRHRADDETKDLSPSGIAMNGVILSTFREIGSGKRRAQRFPRPPLAYLASHGALLSDERLQLVVYDPRQQKRLEDRVLVHGEDELGRTAGGH